MGQTSHIIDALPGAHFEIYTQLLKTFVKYVQGHMRFRSNEPSEALPSDRLSLVKYVQDHVRIYAKEPLEVLSSDAPSFDDLLKALKAFLDVEPADIRSYYMLYIIGIMALGKGREHYGTARKYLEKANKIEPTVIASILKTGISRRELKWKFHGFNQSFK